MKFTGLLNLILSCSVLSSYAQDLMEFNYAGKAYDDALLIGLAYGITAISNREAPNSDAHSNTIWVPSVVDLKRIRLGKGERSMRFTNKAVGDAIFGVAKAFKNPNNILRDENSSLTSGLVGWWNWTWNVNRASNWVLSGGVNFHDYFFGSTYSGDTISNATKRATYEPNGYYFAAGPTFAFQYALSNRFILEATTSYSISFWRPIPLRYGEENKEAVLPHWIQVNVGLMSTWGFFAEMNFNRIINRHTIPNSTQRFDAFIGYRFIVNRKA